MELSLKKPIVFFDLETTGVAIAKDRIVEISIFSLVNQIKSVESIKYNGIPLEIPITKIKIWFLLQYNFKKFPNIFVEFLLINTIIIT